MVIDRKVWLEENKTMKLATFGVALTFFGLVTAAPAWPENTKNSNRPPVADGLTAEQANHIDDQPEACSGMIKPPYRLS